MTPLARATAAAINALAWAADRALSTALADRAICAFANDTHLPTTEDDQ